MGGDRRAGGFAEPGDHVHDAVGQPRLLDQLSEPERAQRGLLGGFENNCAAGHVLDQIGDERHVGDASHAHRLAVVERLDRGQLVGVLEHQLADRE